MILNFYLPRDIYFDHRVRGHGAGPRYQEVCAWTFLRFSYRFFHLFLSLSLLIFPYIAHLSHIFVLTLLVHLDKQGF